MQTKRLKVRIEKLEVYDTKERHFFNLWHTGGQEKNRLSKKPGAPTFQWFLREQAVLAWKPSDATGLLSGTLISLIQWFSIGVLQEFLKHATPEYLVRGTDSFPLDCQIKKKKKTANRTIAIWWEWIKNYTNFFVRAAKYVFWCVSEF